MTDLWDKLLAEGYEQIVHIPMSSGLSGSCQTARMLADDYEGKVFVVNNQRISVTQRQSALDAKELAEAGFNGEQIFEILERVKMESSIYITVDTPEIFKEGRPYHPGGSCAGNAPSHQAGAADPGREAGLFSKVRTMKQARTTMLAAAEEGLKKIVLRIRRQRIPGCLWRTPRMMKWRLSSQKKSRSIIRRPELFTVLLCP